MITRVKGSTFRTVDNFGFSSVADMGPAGTDVTTALQAALTAGTPVYVPIGTWLIGQLILPAGAIIFGEGPKSILKLKDLANTVALNLAVDNVFLSNFAVDGNKANQVGSNFHGIDMNVCTNSLVERVLVYNTKGSGFAVRGASAEITIAYCRATGFTENGFLVSGGSNISLMHPKAYSSDVAASGDGIAIASAGTTISYVDLVCPVSKNNSGRGIALLGNGSKNVLGVTVTEPRCVSNISHGVHLINVDASIVTAGVAASNGGDGFRLEGDVQNCRMVTNHAKANTGFGIREITAGASPNFNGLIYGITAGNGNNVITKVGASSYIV